MRLQPNDILSGNIYHEYIATLAERIDFAWMMYTATEEASELRKKSLEFLAYAFNISDFNNINQQLQLLMAERQLYKVSNPDYVPTKSPKTLPFHAGKNPIDSTSHDDATSLAVAQKELLVVCNSEKKTDIRVKTCFFSAIERSIYRVHIHKGLFKQNGAVFSTRDMKSHGKNDFGAFTLNANGELSVFNHLRMVNGIAHSSMNAGSPVVAAGEIRIEDGVLKTLTTYSGHYRPSLFTMYRVLEHFADHGVSIADAHVITLLDPQFTFNILRTVINLNGVTAYKINARELYNEIDNLIIESINTIHKELEHYNETGIVSTIFTLKDKISGSDLTQKRAELAAAFVASVTSFAQSMRTRISPVTLSLKITQLDHLINSYRIINDELSAQHGKGQNNGRLANSLNVFSQQLNSIKNNPDINETQQFQESLKRVY